MDLFVTLLRALVPLFALIAIGVGLRRWAVIAHEHVPVLNGLVLNVLLPAAVVLGLVRAPTLGVHMLLLPTLLMGAEAILLALMVLAAKRAGFSNSLVGAVLLTGVFGNTAFLGYPVTQALMPRQFPSAVMVDEFGMMVVLYPFAAWLGGRLSHGEGEQEGPKDAVLRFLRGPLFWSLVIGIVLNLLAPVARPLIPDWGRQVGAVLEQVLGYLAAGTTPVVLIALGLALKPGSGQRDRAPLLMATMGKLLLLPVIAWGACALAGVTGEGRAIVVLQAAMPSGVLTSILAREHGFDGVFAVKTVCVATAASLITIPLVLFFLR